MTYALAIADRAYSSWSLRGWLLFERFAIPVRCESARLYTDALPRLLQGYAPARMVPAMRTPEGVVVGETIAIAETLAERHPEAGHWPADPAARALARWLAAEMHAGFTALRGDCPMNLGKSYAAGAPRAEVLADLARIEALWALARARHGAGGPWLFGAYGAADAFYAPVAARIAGYGLPVGPEAAAYVAAHLADPAFRRWRAMALAEAIDQPVYARPFAERPWPGPAPQPAECCEGPSVNAACPCCGGPVARFLRQGGRVWGFCTAFSRDRVLHDPEAWPDFRRIAGAAAGSR